MRTDHFEALQKKQLPIYFLIVALLIDFGLMSSFYIFGAINLAHNFVLKDIICYCENPKHVSLEYVVNFFILYAKFFIHKQKWCKSSLCLSFLLAELNSLISSFRLINNNNKKTFWCFMRTCCVIVLCYVCVRKPMFVLLM